VISVATSLMEIPRSSLSQRIVITEADPATQTRLLHLLSVEGYSVELASGWARCKELLRATPVSVLVLDPGMVNIPAARLYEEIRAIGPDLSIIVLGPSSSVAERVLSLELGADDYVSKPFDGREFLARVRAAIRRSQLPRAEVSSFGDVQVDFRSMEVRRLGVPLTFTAQEFKVLKFMMQNSERVLTRDELLNTAWGYFSYPTTRTVDNHILRLRQKLEPDPSDPVHFLTIHSVGYKFVPNPRNPSFTSGRSARQI
jgi:DNA-binding response OmpR family regulator